MNLAINLIAWLTGADRPPRRIASKVWAARRRKRYTVPGGAIALVVAVLVIGVADALYHPTIPDNAHPDGREKSGAAGTMPNVAIAPMARVNSLTLPFRGAPARVQLVDGGPMCDDWRARLPSDGHPDGWDKLTHVDYIIVHNTGTRAGVRADAQAVANYHVGRLGWEHTGYHVHVNRDGGCQWALTLNATGYHSFTWNARSIAVVLESTGPYGLAQIATYKSVVAALMRRYNVPLSRVWGHRDTSEYDARNDQTPWGQVILNRNDHVDPCAGGSDCGWDIDRFGLDQFVAAGGGTIDPPPTPTPTASPSPRPSVTPTRVVISVAPTPPPNPTSQWTHATGRVFDVWPRPSRVTGVVYSGQATYYQDGQVTASGEPFDPNNPYIAATYLTSPYVNGRPQPAWQFGTWVRVTNRSNGRWRDVEVLDTGAFGPPALLDLSREAFSRLDSLARGRIDVNIEVVHTPPDNGQPDPCDWVPMGGAPVCYVFRTEYRGKFATYGFPLTRQQTLPDRTVFQIFERATMFWNPARGLWVEAK